MKYNSMVENGGKNKVIDLLPNLQQLERNEKLFIIQFLVSELSQEEEPLILANADYPVWSPFGAYEAAEDLTQFLNKKNREV